MVLPAGREGVGNRVARPSPDKFPADVCDGTDLSRPGNGPESGRMFWFELIAGMVSEDRHARALPERRVTPETDAVAHGGAGVGPSAGRLVRPSET